jgi:hypothetical protein
MTKIIIAGGREFKNYLLLVESLLIFLNKFKIPFSELQIVSGCAKGADKLGIKFAENNQISLRLMPADWDKHRKSAGYIRNAEMAKYADMLLVFWDGKSKGTKHMIETMQKLGKKVHVVRYDKRWK